MQLLKYATRSVLFLACLFLLGSGDTNLRNQFTIVGYHPYWMKDNWKQYDLKMYDQVVFFALYVEEDGNFKSLNGWPMSWAELVLSARGQQAKVVPSFTLLDAQKVNRLFSDAASIARLKTNVMNAARIANADGVHLDFEMFEPITPIARKNYTTFIKDIRTLLNQWKWGKELAVFTLALDPADAYDEAAIARYADKLVVQGFDLHWKSGPSAGPVSPVAGWGQRNWQNIVARYDALGVARKKLVFSVPFYGYEWPTVTSELGSPTRGAGETISYSNRGVRYASTIRYAAKERAAKFGLKRDPASGSPYYVYQTANGWFQGWYEDHISLEKKYQFIKQKGLGGVAVFVPGYDDGVLTNGLKQAFPGVR